MLASLATNPLNYILHNESWACKKLQAHEGKIVCIRIPPFVNFKMIVLASGELGHYQENPDLEADTTLTLYPAILPGLLAKAESAYDNIEISGNDTFAKDLITIGKNLKPNFEQDLGKILGDIPAHRIANASESFFTWHLNTINNLTDAFGEYWQEEQPIITKHNAINITSKAIHELQQDVNQLESRINRIIQETTHKNC